MSAEKLRPQIFCKNYVEKIQRLDTERKRGGHVRPMHLGVTQ